MIEMSAGSVPMIRAMKINGLQLAGNLAVKCFYNLLEVSHPPK
jgi:hypothetical protein